MILQIPKAAPAITKLQWKAGILIFISYVLYFLAMKYAGLLESILIRSLNFLILIVGILLALRKYKSINNKPTMYLSGLWFCFITGFISVVLFSLFISLYFNYTDSELLLRIKDNSLMLENYTSPFSIFITTMIEGGCSVLVISFSMMQFFINDRTHQ